MKWRFQVLQPVDIAVAFAAALRVEQDGAWSPKGVRDDLDLPWSSLHLSLSRLDEANLVRNGRVNRRALAELLPALRYLMPVRADRTRRVHGIPTGVSAPVFAGRVVSSVPLVWETADGDTVGVPIDPLHKHIPRAAAGDPGRHALFACLDAIRMGRSREMRIAGDKLRELAGLPGAAQ
jgi:hypothetical protein